MTNSPEHSFEAPESPRIYSTEELSGLQMNIENDGDNVEVVGNDESPETKDMLAFVGEQVTNVLYRGFPSPVRENLINGEEIRPSAYAISLGRKPLEARDGESPQYVSVLELDTRNARGVQQYRDELQQSVSSILQPPPPKTT
jgi:hypothetical protein